jgi:prolyl-tRNA synthetase
MLQSKLFYFAKKDFPKDEESLNAKYLIRAGFVEKLSAGVYHFLPLGLRVLNKLVNLVRKEMNLLEAQEVLLPALHPKENWLITQRWEKFDALFKIKSRTENEYALGPTHEEVIFPLLKKGIQSYKDLPIALFQIQTKFRDELRAKAGLLRCREFIMKDLYSFHKDSKEVEKYKEKVDKAYLKIFKLLNLPVYKTLASGGTFSDFSTEFQVPTENGEDEIFVCENCNIAWNREIFNEIKCKNCKKEVFKTKAIEVGNTFNLGTGFSEKFQLKYKDKNGKENFVFAGCYGLGITRLIGAVVEVFHDENGIIWPKIISPYSIHFLILKEKIKLKDYEKIFEIFEKFNLDFLIDDRKVSFGQKLVESDLLGISLRIITSDKLKDKFEVKLRDKKDVKILNRNQLVNFLKDYVSKIPFSKI